MNKRDEMIRLCLEFPVPDDSNVVIERPYIPWVPEAWNEILVLAESQNLSETNCDYVTILHSLSDKKQVCRLYDPGKLHDLGIAPWDDGSLKLAVEAAFNEDAHKTAVSNAVLWSQVTESNTNRTPSPELMTASAELWSQLLPVLRPRSVITAGNVAHQVIANVKEGIDLSFDHLRLRLPSKNAMSRVSGIFKEDDLLRRYPEVARAAKKHSDWTDKFTLNKIFYACHAVSLHGKDSSNAHARTDAP